MVQLLLACYIQNDLNKSWCIFSFGMFYLFFFFLPNDLKKLCLLALSMFLLHFGSLERKNAFQRVTPFWNMLFYDIAVWIPTVTITSPNCEYGIFPILKNCKYLWSKKHKDNYPLYWNVKEYAKNTWACQKCDPWTSNNPFQEIFTQIFWPYQEKDPFNTF